MHELAALIDLYGSVRASGGTAVLATVVNTSGSTYRKSGARMLVAADGRSAGLISGGCLETDLRERSAGVFARGTPLLVTYDATAPGDILWGLGLGCPGIAQVLLERVSAEHSSPALEFLSRLRERRSGGAIATLYRTEGSGPVGSLFLLEEGAPPPAARDQREERLRDACAGALRTRRSTNARIPLPGGSAEALIEYVAPQVALTICGAGPDAVPLARLAHELGWRVTIVDPRAAYLTREFFPSAHALLLARPGEQDIPPADAYVVMTHNYGTDLDALRALLRAGGGAYIGLLGPGVKARMLLEKIAAEGVGVPAEDVRRIHAPVGLDIGAETPDEIALAVVAEIQAALHGRPGTPLREREGPIHG